ncbi:MAG: glycoside hydrolase family 3 N-terminal domain-containing protein [Vampirovibrionales bacterium]|nr:glycoside hydrolase family 3 N-terminal domain-containing protein [Vampirovibrionales bacterium]
MDDLTALRAQVWQRLVCGYTTYGAPPPAFRQALASGLGGVILFRHNLQSGATLLMPQAILSLTQDVYTETLNATGTPPWIWVDQEGGPVERFPCQVFPSLPSPWALGKRPALLQQAQTLQCEALRTYGIHSACTPCADVNTESTNPVIHVRAYGDTSSQVTQAVLAVMQSQLAHDILPIAKHFPGHGNSTIDSHASRPVLPFEPEMLAPFKALIRAGCPAVMVAHAAYPELNARYGEPETTPASLSKGVLQNMLRHELGFEGLIVTDDLHMGAVDTSIETALQALTAGADILLYRQIDDAVLAVVEGLTQALAENAGLRAAHEKSLERIRQAKTRFALPPLLSAEPLQAPKISFWQTQAQALANALLKPVLGALPVRAEQRPQVWLLPDRSKLHSYAPDLQLEALEVLLDQDPDVRVCCYDDASEAQVAEALHALKPEAIIVAVTVLPKLGGSLPLWIERHGPAGWPSRCIWVSAGLPEADLPPNLNAWLQPASWRPPVIQALAQMLLERV